MRYGACNWCASVPIIGALMQPRERKSMKGYAASSAFVVRHSGERCPKCGMLAHAPDQWCNTIPTGTASAVSRAYYESESKHAAEVRQAAAEASEGRCRCALPVTSIQYESYCYRCGLPLDG